MKYIMMMMILVFSAQIATATKCFDSKLGEEKSSKEVEVEKEVETSSNDGEIFDNPIKIGDRVLEMKIVTDLQIKEVLIGVLDRKIKTSLHDSLSRKQKLSQLELVRSIKKALDDNAIKELDSRGASYWGDDFTVRSLYSTAVFQYNQRLSLEFSIRFRELIGANQTLNDRKIIQKTREMVDEFLEKDSKNREEKIGVRNV